MSDGQDRAPDGGGSVKRAAAVRRKSRGGISGTAATTVWGYLTDFPIVGESRGDALMPSRSRADAASCSTAPGTLRLTPSVIRCSRSSSTRRWRDTPAALAGDRGPLKGIAPSARLSSACSPQLGPSHGLNWGHAAETHWRHCFRPIRAIALHRDSVTAETAFPQGKTLGERRQNWGRSPLLPPPRGVVRPNARWGCTGARTPQCFRALTACSR